MNESGNEDLRDALDDRGEEILDYVEKNSGWPKRTEACDKNS